MIKMNFTGLIKTKIRLLLLITICFGQAQTVINVIDKQVIRLGEPIELKISISNLPKNINPDYLIPKDSIGSHLEIIEIRDTIIQNNPTKIIIFSGYEPGAFKTDPIKILIDKDTLKSGSFPIEVKDIEVDEAKQPMHDIKDVVGGQPTMLDKILSAWWIILLVILTITAVVALVIYMSSRKKTDKKEVKKLLPYEIAIMELKELSQKDYLIQGKSKKYYSEMIDILKDYMETRYQLPAKLLLTADLLTLLKNENLLSENEIQLLQTIFTASDLAKFAKSRPAIDESQKHLNQAIHFIEKTKPEFNFVNKPVDHI